jgi:hypothetical protein
MPHPPIRWDVSNTVIHRVASAAANDASVRPSSDTLHETSNRPVGLPSIASRRLPPLLPVLMVCLLPGCMSARALEWPVVSVRLERVAVIPARGTSTSAHTPTLPSPTLPTLAAQPAHIPPAVPALPPLPGPGDPTVVLPALQSLPTPPSELAASTGLAHVSAPSTCDAVHPGQDPLWACIQIQKQLEAANVELHQRIRHLEQEVQQSRLTNATLTTELDSTQQQLRQVSRDVTLAREQFARLERHLEEQHTRDIERLDEIAQLVKLVAARHEASHSVEEPPR